MKIIYESQNSGKHIVVDTVLIKKNKKGFFTCKLLQDVMDDKQIESVVIEHASGKGYSKPEAFLAALNELGVDKQKENDDDA